MATRGLCVSHGEDNLKASRIAIIVCWWLPFSLVMMQLFFMALHVLRLLNGYEDSTNNCVRRHTRIKLLKWLERKLEFVSQLLYQFVFTLDIYGPNKVLFS